MLQTQPVNSDPGTLLRGGAAPAVGFDAIVGQSAAIQEAVWLARKVSATPGTTVLLDGPTGSGKELFARGIHYWGATRGAPFVAVNCAAIPEQLLESELFGHERHALGEGSDEKVGLLEVAGEGTLLLDEVSGLPLSLQPKLLRALEERQVRRIGGVGEIPVRCRIIASASRALEELVSRGEFREELYYRLNVFRITLPALRQRDDDVELLARHFLAALAREHRRAPSTFSADALEALRSYPWPGNVRELKNVVERAAILADGPCIGSEHLMIQHRTSMFASTATQAPAAEIRIPPGGKLLRDIEREAIYLTLQMTQGNQSAAARVLGISRPTLARKLKQLRLKRLTREQIV